jgi:hypothetical protein
MVKPCSAAGLNFASWAEVEIASPHSKNAAEASTRPRTSKPAGGFLIKLHAPVGLFHIPSPDFLKIDSNISVETVRLLWKTETNKEEALEAISIDLKNTELQIHTGIRVWMD